MRWYIRPPFDDTFFFRHSVCYFTCIGWTSMYSMYVCTRISSTEEWKCVSHAGSFTLRYLVFWRWWLIAWSRETRGVSQIRYAFWRIVTTGLGFATRLDWQKAFKPSTTPMIRLVRKCATLMWSKHDTVRRVNIASLFNGESWRRTIQYVEEWRITTMWTNSQSDGRPA